MRVKCDRHGGRPGVLTSADIAEAAEHQVSLTDVLEIETGLPGGVFGPLIVSRAFALDAGVEGLTVVPAGDDWPQWVLELVPSCEKCIEQTTGLKLAWKPG